MIFGDAPTICCDDINSLYTFEQHTQAVADMGRKANRAKAVQRGEPASPIWVMANKLPDGYSGIARMLGIHRSTVCHWDRPRELKGRGGEIPPEYHDKLLRKFAERRIYLSIGELTSDKGD